MFFIGYDTYYMINKKHSLNGNLGGIMKCEKCNKTIQNEREFKGQTLCERCWKEEYYEVEFGEDHKEGYCTCDACKRIMWKEVGGAMD